MLYLATGGKASGTLVTESGTQTGSLSQETQILDTNGLTFSSHPVRVALKFHRLLGHFGNRLRGLR